MRIVCLSPLWLLFSAAPAFVLAADLPITVIPQPLVFTIGGRGTQFAISAAQDFEVASIRPLSLTDRGTGRPSIPEAVAVNELKVDNATPRLHQFTATVERKPLSSSAAFDGVLGIVYRSAGQVASTTVAFQVLADGFNPAFDKPGEATLSVISAPSKLILKDQAPFRLCLAADKGSVVIGSVTVGGLAETTSGRVLDTSQIQLNPPPGMISPPRQGCLDGKLSGALPPDTFRVSATLNVVYRAAAPGAGWKSLAWSIEFSQPAAELRFGTNGEARVLLTRANPLAPYQEFSTCIDYRTTPADALLPDKLELRAAITTNDANHPAYPDNARLKAAVSSKSVICLTPRFPRGLTTLRGKVLVLPPYVGKETELNPIFLLKDAWYWRLLAVMVAYGCAMLLQWGTSHVRRKILHNGTRRNLSDRLSQFLAGRPDLSNDSSVVLARQLLADSISLDRDGEFDLADQNLQSATTRINDLIAAPPAAQTPLGGASSIRVAQPATQQIAGRSLKLIAADPAGLNLPGSVEWEILDAAGASLFHQKGPNLLSVRFSFPAPGTYRVKVSSSGVPTPTPLTRDVTVIAAPAKDPHGGLRALDLLTHGIALTLASAAAYVSTASADAWGSPADYITLLGAAFGVGAGAQALRLTIGAVRGTG